MATSSRLHDRWRNAKRRVARRLADRRTRRRIVLVLVTVLAVGALAAVKGLIGYFVFSSKSTRFEVALVILAIVAAIFALGERKIASALEARFNRNTKKHREALAQLRDELAELPDRKKLEQRLLSRFDELFGTTGTALYIDDGVAYAPVAHSRRAIGPPLAYDDPLVAALRDKHAPVAPADVGSDDRAPLAWPLRSRGHLIGILAGGEHDYLESFDATEVEAIEGVADAAAANLALLDPAITVHLVRTPNNLPPSLNTFVGRERDLDECRGILETTRFLTLTGFGGAGKSRLARQIAEEALATRRGGVWWVELADAQNESHVHSAIVAATGMTESNGEPLSAAKLARHCGDGGVLIVFDTCEHVRAACASLAADLLRESPRLALLATSQSPLGVSGERDYAVPPLDVPEVDAEQEALLRCDAVRLFVERAKLVVPEFAPTAADLSDIAAIVRALDGIPLAIELAAARTKLLSLAAIREHLAESLRLLAGGDHGDARHETMRASLAWSYDPLAEIEQRLLRRLSVFANGFTLDAAARVTADAGDALAVLDPVGRLVEASLILVARYDDEPRYHMPETLRQFLSERLDRDDDAPVIRRRHATYYVELAKKETAALHHREMARALMRLDREAPNLAAAHAWWMRSADGSEMALELAHALTPYWRDRGLVLRGRERLREALTHPESSDSRLHAEVLLDLADFDPAQATTSLAEALRIARAFGANDLASRALVLEAQVLQERGQTGDARRFLDEAVALARRAGDAQALRAVLDDAGECLAAAGWWEDAAEAIDESLSLARAADDVAALHLAARDAARVAIGRRDLVRARGHLLEAVDIALASHAELDGEHDLEVTSLLAVAEADFTRAARYAGAAAAATAAMGNPRMLTGNGIGAVELAAQRAALGEVQHAVAFEAGRRVKLAAALADAREWLGGAPR